MQFGAVDDIFLHFETMTGFTPIALATEVFDRLFLPINSFNLYFNVLPNCLYF